MDQLRRDKEEQKFKEKQDTRQKLIQRQTEVLMNIKNKDDEILNKQVMQAEEKALHLFNEQEKKKREMKEAIERSRQQQISRKQAERNYEKQQEKEFQEFWKIRNEELQIAEQQEKEEERMRKAELQNNHKQMIDQKRIKTELDYKKELQDAANTQAMVDFNSKQFYSYAESCVKNWQEQGKNIKPLVLELKTYNQRIIS